LKGLFKGPPSLAKRNANRGRGSQIYRVCAKSFGDVSYYYKTSFERYEEGSESSFKDFREFGNTRTYGLYGSKAYHESQGKDGDLKGFM
jgi:hypothetical protein